MEQTSIAINVFDGRKLIVTIQNDFYYHKVGNKMYFIFQKCNEEIEENKRYMYYRIGGELYQVFGSNVLKVALSDYGIKPAKPNDYEQLCLF